MVTFDSFIGWCKSALVRGGDSDVTTVWFFKDGVRLSMAQALCEWELLAAKMAGADSPGHFDYLTNAPFVVASPDAWLSVNHSGGMVTVNRHPAKGACIFLGDL